MISLQRTGPVAIVTLDRPEARNALTGAMIDSLAEVIEGFGDDEDVRVAVLTGRDPAFCAGLDLTDLARTYDDVTTARPRRTARWRGLFPPSTVPIIAAVNGPAVTGGLEVALGCDFMIASDRATFADTHARVGVMPGGGMTIRLPQLIGINRARQMSLTGNFIDAVTACSWGLVSEVVPHERLLERAMELALAVAESGAEAIGELRTMYEELGHRGDDEAFAEEARWSRRWMTERFDPDALAQQRARIIERGSAQQ